ncbi:DUF7322 domain-containing protein [Natronorubrum sp. DTA7]|uniref:DUF7322 domain-containing protein n=1 Tax=Natronorubrum sp. DTA7 TaxID=3447016 RepID=UPI003F856DBB
MGLDRSEHEPDEYDPEEEFRDPDSDSLTIPQVSTENAGSSLRSDLKSELEEDAIPEPEFSATETDVDGETLKSFWALVLVINAAVLAYALGALFLIFEGATTYASYLFAAGLVLTGFGIRRYRAFQREGGTDSSNSSNSSNSSDDDRDRDSTSASPAADDQSEAATHSDRTNETADSDRDAGNTTATADQTADTAEDADRK